jgi:hypothetical protein
LHNLLPHEHDIANDDYNLVLSEPADFDFSFFIKNIFLQDLGEDHLENFHISDGDQIVHFDFVISPISIPTTSFSFFPKILPIRLDVSGDYKDPPDFRFKNSSLGLRAPPYTA